MKISILNLKRNHTKVKTKKFKINKIVLNVSLNVGLNRPYRKVFNLF